MPDGVPAEPDDPLFDGQADADHGIRWPRTEIVIELHQCFGLTLPEAEERLEEWGQVRSIREVMAERGHTV